jgi:hypothetical protein
LIFDPPKPGCDRDRSLAHQAGHTCFIDRWIYLRPAGTPTPDQAGEELQRYHYNSRPAVERIKGRR